ncbi:MAG: hypothetical protein J0H66_14655 [Solirubrobacterales bacterium]|nr:hypothetical protein [Solirubrobacterales bacterium]OJU95656.1 MAG: hypothetical protein BGO23_08590 [Solirubrobacterales bacterium 67-14]
MNGSIKKFGITGLAIVALLAGVVFIAGCGGSDSSSDDSTSTEQAGGPGGMFASLTDDQKQCLEEAGVTLPEAPSGDAPQDGDMPQGQPPEGMTPPDGATGASGATGPPGGGQVPEGMQDLQSAMEECGVDMPDLPQGGQAPDGDQGGDGTAVETQSS